jgi:5'-deoxynucleotidase YfbR-like HD superfamily hydrolase
MNKNNIESKLRDNGDWFGTSSGSVVYALAPETSDVNIEDIAHALARQCRFAGHIRQDVWHYSVAQHSVIVSQACLPKSALIGLLHDAAEAYVQHVIRPIKRIVGSDYHIARRRWALAIGEQFNEVKG